LLHIGNIKISDVRGNAQVDDADPSLLMACKLLGIEASEFKKWLTKRQIITRSEKIIKDADFATALVSRDSVSKFIYSMLFDWLVKIVNAKLEPPTVQKDRRFIGVLDIYGFEHFERNSFEQFCINYANEKLQQEFTRHVFKLEQEEYVAEQIAWSFIDFADNGPCIELIEAKLGILDLLDEESRLPSGRDENLVTKLYNRFATGGQTPSNFFEKPRFGGQEFTVKHYALDVSYQITGFIEKNKDTVSDEQLETLNNSNFEFLKEVIAPPSEEAEVVTSPKMGRPAGGAKKKATLGSIFKSSLVALMETLRETNPHYIRCIKPNQAKVAFEFEPQNVLGQLVACGVLETIKISRAGYPSKQTYLEFVDRYYFLVPSSKWNNDTKKLTEEISSKYIKPGNFELGLRKIFFRAGQLAFLEKVRSETFTKIIVLLQKNTRRNLAQKNYKAMKKATILAQSRWRGILARKLTVELRQTKAVILIQRNWRMALARKRFTKIAKAVVTIQRSYRRHVRRKNFEYFQRLEAAVKIQKVFRGHKARKQVKKSLKSIILIQSCIRRRKCRLAFKILKVEARSVGNLKKVNYKLESKIVELSQKVGNMNKEHLEMAEKNTHLESQLHSYKEKLAKLDAEYKNSASDNVEEVQALRKQVAALISERETLAKDGEKAQAMIRKRDDQLAALTAEVASQSEEIKKLKERKETEDTAPKKDDAGVAALKKEVASLREQMSRIVAGKYATDKQTESFLNNDYSASTENAARNAMSFFESAAQVTAQVAESWIGSSSNIVGMASSPSKSSIARTQEVEYSEPKDRPIRMLEAKDLEDEIIDSLITNLRIPLPSTQSVATRNEIFFPAHLIGYLVSQLQEHRLVDRMNTLTEHIMKCNVN
jgi:myosin V